VVKKAFSSGALFLIRGIGRSYRCQSTVMRLKIFMHDDSIIEDATKDIDIVFKIFVFRFIKNISFGFS